MYDVIIVGGGLSGCSAAIHLAKNELRVLLIERETYPKHKICGEFLSTEVGDLLRGLDVYDNVILLRAARIRHAQITVQGMSPMKINLPGEALGISRFALDHLLIRRAETVGAHIVLGTAVLSIEGNWQESFEVKTADRTYQGKLVLGAYGKKSGLDAKLGRPSQSWKAEYVGFKQHYVGNGPENTVEVHAFDGGYCGINRVEGDAINVCWLARRSLLDQFGGNYKAVMQHHFLTNPALWKRMTGLREIPGTFCAVGSITLATKGLFANDVCLIGDTTQMIAPFCGDGMGMALKTGESIAPLCAALLRKQISHDEFVALYSKIWHQNFDLRLHVGKLLQTAALSPRRMRFALKAISILPRLGDFLVQSSRGYGTNSSRQPSIVSPGPNASATPKV